MAAERLSYRYAKALIDLAREQGVVEKVKENVEVLLKATEHRELLLLFKSPIVSKMKKASIIEELFGDDFEDMTMSFMDILLTKGREPYIPEIAQEFINQYRAGKHISTVQLTTAEPITPDALNAVRSKLEQSGVLEQNVEIETKVDKSLIGGFKLEFNDRLYDASVAHRLNEMRKAFA